jgi:hypothetical protein
LSFDFGHHGSKLDSCFSLILEVEDVPKFIVPFMQELYQSIAGELDALVGITAEKTA